MQSRVAGRIDRLTRDSYARLLALLAAPTRDIAAAEDALADALERALVAWTDEGVPANPEAWVLTVARNRLRDLWRSSHYRDWQPIDETHDRPAQSADVRAIADRRLELMLVCAHPAIDAGIHTPLMLQVVLGIDAAAVAAAFAVEPATMAQRLVRAKRRIRATGIAFAYPEREDLAQRLPAVLEAVYGAYAVDWPLAGAGPPVESLSAEARHLADVLVELLPDEPEVLGLAALLCLSEARRPARRGPGGGFIPLDEQDRTRWDAALLARGETLLHRAHGFGRPGRFQYEAAIQSAHCAPHVDWTAVQKLHRALMRLAPSLGAQVAAAAVDAEVDGPMAGLAVLDAIADPAVDRFQPAWSTRAHLLARAGRVAEAAQAYRRAIELTPDAGMAGYLRERLAAVVREPGP